MDYVTLPNTPLYVIHDVSERDAPEIINRVFLSEIDAKAYLISFCDVIPEIIGEYYNIMPVTYPSQFDIDKCRQESAEILAEIAREEEIDEKIAAIRIAAEKEIAALRPPQPRGKAGKGKIGKPVPVPKGKAVPGRPKGKATKSSPPDLRDSTGSESEDD